MCHRHKRSELIYIEITEVNVTIVALDVTIAAAVDIVIFGTNATVAIVTVVKSLQFLQLLKF
jgi:hypothetical protein